MSRSSQTIRSEQDLREVLKGNVAIIFLSDEQSGVSRQFARRGADKWDGVERLESPLGNPVIARSLEWLDCQIHAEHTAGDHLIVIG